MTSGLARLSDLIQLLTVLAVLRLTPPAVIPLPPPTPGSAVTVGSLAVAPHPPLHTISRSTIAYRAANEQIGIRRSSITSLQRSVAPVPRPRGRKRRRQFNELTRREQEIIRLLIRGVSNKEIAEQLSISERTVKGHLTHVYSKLGVSSRLQLAVSTFQTSTKVP